MDGHDQPFRAPASPSRQDGEDLGRTIPDAPRLTLDDVFERARVAAERSFREGFERGWSARERQARDAEPARPAPPPLAQSPAAPERRPESRKGRQDQGDEPDAKGDGDKPKGDGDRPKGDRDKPGGEEKKDGELPEDEEKDKKDEDDPGRRRRRLIAFGVAGLVLLALIIAGVFYWLHARHYESTDDAFVDGHIAQVAPQVSGRVTRLLVDDNQEVKTGDLLIEIDSRDFDVRLAQAQAGLGNAQGQLAQVQAQVGVQQASIDQNVANVQVAEADLFQADRDLKRFKAIDPKAITAQQVDSATATQRSAQARRDAAQQAVTSARAQLEATKAQVVAAEASVRQAEADVANARLQLSYAQVKAPQDGRVTRRTVEVGNHVSPQAPILSIVASEVWVTANFKESQLGDMKPGQPVEIAIDAFPDQAFKGHIDSLQSGTGSVFSSLPAENATGNYVKIVQRLPIKIVFDQELDDDHRLAPGMSVVPRVKVR